MKQRQIQALRELVSSEKEAFNASSGQCTTLTLCWKVGGSRRRPKLRLREAGLAKLGKEPACPLPPRLGPKQRVSALKPGLHPGTTLPGSQFSRAGTSGCAQLLL